LTSKHASDTEFQSSAALEHWDFILFTQFHIMEATLPSFEPDFKNGSKIGF